MRESKPRPESDLRSSREAKRRRTGTCEGCGAVTHYGGGKEHPVARFCPSCAQSRAQARRRGTGSAQARILAFIGDGERRFTEIGAACGFSPGAVAQHMHRLVKFGIVERPRRGVYRKARADA